MPEPWLFLCLVLQFFQEPDIGEVHLPEFPEIEQVNDHRNGNCQETPENIWMKKTHNIREKRKNKHSKDKSGALEEMNDSSFYQTFKRKFYFKWLQIIKEKYICIRFLYQ